MCTLVKPSFSHQTRTELCCPSQCSAVTGVTPAPPLSYRERFTLLCLNCDNTYSQHWLFRTTLNPSRELTGARQGTQLLSPCLLPYLPPSPAAWGGWGTLGCSFTPLLVFHLRMLYQKQELFSSHQRGPWSKTKARVAPSRTWPRFTHSLEGGSAEQGWPNRGRGSNLQ